MDVPDLDLKQCTSIFVRDEFYENIAAPKYHHFPPSEEPADDAFFRKLGEAKNFQKSQAICLEPRLIQEDSVLLKTEEIRVCGNGSSRPDDSSTVERAASSRGKNKVRPTLSSTTLTNSQDKIRIQRKFALKVNVPSNAPVPPTSSEKINDERIQHPEFHRSSENQDPNLNRAQRKRDAGDGSKSDRSRSSSAFAAIQSMFEMKNSSERMVKDSQCDGVDASDKNLKFASQRVKSGAKYGVRKPSGNSVDALRSKCSESKRLTRSQVRAAQRKVSENAESEQAAKSTSRSASQFTGVVRNALGPSCTLATTTNTKKICPAERTLRSTFSRAANQLKGVVRNAFSANSTTATIISEEASSKVAPKGSSVADDDVRQRLNVIPLVSSTGQVVTSFATVQDEVEHIQKEGPSADYASLIEFKEIANSAEQPLKEIDESSQSHQAYRREGELLSEHLQSLQITQEPEHLSRFCGKATHQPNGELEEQEGCSHGSPELIACDAFPAVAGVDYSLPAFVSVQPQDIDLPRLDFSQDLDNLKVPISLDGLQKVSELKDDTSVMTKVSQDGVLSFTPNKDEEMTEQACSPSGSLLDEALQITGQVCLSGESSRHELSQLTEEACFSSASSSCPSDHGFRAQIETINTFVVEDAKLSKNGEQCSSIGCKDTFSTSMCHAKPCQLKENNKRKSVDLSTHKGSNSNEYPRPPAVTSALLGPTVRAAEQQKKMKTTCPQPFRLRTQERGALKEVQFNMKIVQYHLEKEKSELASLVSGTVKEVKGIKQSKVPSKESRWPMKAVPCRQGHAAVGAGLKHEEEVQPSQHTEDKIKELQKKLVPQSRKMPSFDRPFKPHRSMKPPTIPSSPNFSRRFVKRWTKGKADTAAMS